MVYYAIEIKIGKEKDNARKKVRGYILAFDDAPIADNIITD